MKKSLIAQWREDMVGDWLEELSGIDLLYLGPGTGRPPITLSLRADGTTASKASAAGEPAVPSQPEAPFPETWELSEDRILSFVIPVAPMPEFGMPNWTRETMCYDVLAVTDVSLALGDRRFDGETVSVWRRANQEEHLRRKYS
jgi:hypothetical protein